MPSADEYLQSILGGASPSDGASQSNDGITVEDADTVYKDGQAYRMQGADAPETGKVAAESGKYQKEQPGAQLAIDYLKGILNDGGINIEPTGDKSYNREVAKFTDAQGQDVGTRMIERGFARPTMHSGQEQRTAEVTANVRLSGMFDDAFSVEDQAKNRQLAYEKEIQAFEPNYGNVQSGPDLTTGTFSRAVGRGTDNTQGLLYAAANALGEFSGFDALANWGEEGLVRNMNEAAMNPAEIGNSDNIKSLSDLGTYVVEAIGEQIPNIALTATGAGATAVAARAAIGKALLKRAGARFAGLQPVGEAANVMQGIIKKEAAANLAKSSLVKAAPLAGAAAASYPLGVGEVQQELKGAGIDAPGTALLAGLPIAALDAASFDIIFGKLFHGVKRQLAEDLVSGTARALGFVKDVAKGGLVGGLTEVPTEVMQEIIGITAHAYHDPSFEIFSDENLARLREVAIKAGVVGAAGGGFASGVQSIREMPTTPSMPPLEAAPAGQAQDIPEQPIAPEAAPQEAVSPEAPTNPIPEGFKMQMETENGTVADVDANSFIKSEYDDKISVYTQLLKCMGG